MENFGGFFEKKNIDFFQKIAERSKLDVECDWKSKTSRNVQTLVLLKKVCGFFEKTIDFFIKRLKWKFIVGCNWKSKVSQSVKKVVSPLKKMNFRKMILSSYENR